MQLSQQTASFTLPAGSLQTPGVKIAVRRLPDSAFSSFTVTEDASWIQTTKSSGLIPDTVRISVFASGLAGGSYIDTVTIATPEAANSPQLVIVQLTIDNALAVSSSRLTFTSLTNGPDPAAQIVNVTNAGLSPLTVSATTDQGWLLVSPTSATTPISLLVEPTITGLQGGRYGGTITLTAQGAVNSPQTISCSLLVSSWEKVPLISPYDLGDCFFLDEQTGYATGYISNNSEFSGIVLKSVNGGQNWTISKVVTPAAFNGVWFTDSQNGFVVGDSAAIWFTTDGAASWARIPRSTLPVDSAVDFWSVEFADALHGWIVGTDGVILATDNGGASWQRQSSPTTLALASIAIRNSNNLWIAGNGGFILKTSDGGTTWIANENETDRDLWGIDFVDDLTGLIVGENGLILRTTDGGASWNEISSGETTRLQDITMGSATTGWLTGQGGVIRSTSDGGQSWQQQQSGVSAWLFSLWALDTNRAWVAGEDGTVLRTLSGGF